MRIKPKNPKLQKIRRAAVGVVATCAVVGLLLHGQQRTGIPDDSALSLPDSAVSEVSPEDQIPGDLDWEYPEGWVDYSDLPDRDTLGDDDVRGLSNWRYILVNGQDRTNYLRPSYYPEMTTIESGYYGDTMYFQTRAADALRGLLAACRAEGYTVFISRTYFSYNDQKTRFNGMASTIFDRGGVTLAEAEEQVTAMGYYPGADEHQTALAVNLVDENGEAKFNTPMFAWLSEHCADYGFILRYPEGREAYTGHTAEPGHYSYVGEVAAEYIMRKGITLEEFKNAYSDEGTVTFLW